MVEIKFHSLDIFSREVYITKIGTYLVLVDDCFYTKNNNDPDGKPLSRILNKSNLKIVTDFSNNNNNNES